MYDLGARYMTLTYARLFRFRSHTNPFYSHNCHTSWYTALIFCFFFS